MEGEERRCRICCDEKETTEHMWNGCREMKERERKKLGEILNEDEREIRWMKEIWRRSEKIEKERSGGQEKKVNFWNCYFYVCNQESEARKENLNESTSLVTEKSNFCIDFLLFYKIVKSSTSYQVLNIKNSIS
jgi:tRNA A37 N6-isopentenylltransferase MiaA